MFMSESKDLIKEPKHLLPVNSIHIKAAVCKKGYENTHIHIVGLASCMVGSLAFVFFFPCV